MNRVAHSKERRRCYVRNFSSGVTTIQAYLQRFRWMLSGPEFPQPKDVLRDTGVPHERDGSANAGALREADRRYYKMHPSHKLPGWRNWQTHGT